MKRQIDKYVDLARDQEKTLEHESDGDTNCKWCAQYSHHNGTGGLENKRTRGDYSIKIGQNTEKSSGDLRRLAVTQTPVRKPQLALAGKTLKRVK